MTGTMAGLRASVCVSSPARLRFSPLRPSSILFGRPRLPCTGLMRPRRWAGPRAPSGRVRRPALCVKAMVNVDISPSVLLGVGLIGAGVTLWQVRKVKPEISKDYDVVISCVSLLVGGILIFQGWRLDPLLLFGQLMTTGAAVSFAIEALSLRAENYEDEEKEQLRNAFDRKRGGGGGPGAALQLPPPEQDEQQQQAWDAGSSEAGWAQLPPQQQEQQWGGSYAQASSGYSNYQQQLDAVPAGGSGGGYTYQDGQYYRSNGGADSYGNVSADSYGSGGYDQQGYQQPPPQQQYGGGYGGQYVEPDYALPPTDQGGYYAGGGGSRPTEYVFPTDPAAAPGSRGGYGGPALGWSAGAGAAQQQQQQQQPGAGPATRRGVRPVGGVYESEDWD